MESLKLEKFKTKEANLSSIYGGDKTKVQKTCSTEETLGCTITHKDGFYDENGDNEQQCTENSYQEDEYNCCTN